MAKRTREGPIKSSNIQINKQVPNTWMPKDVSGPNVHPQPPIVQNNVFEKVSTGNLTSKGNLKTHHNAM